MNIPGWGKPIILSRAVEDPIEATFDLGQDLKKQVPGLNLTINLGIVISILFIISLSPKIVYFFLTLLNVAAGNTTLGDELTLRIAMLGPTTIILLSLSFTALLFLGQLKKFYGHIYQRYDSVADLKVTDIGSRTGKSKPGKNGGKHWVNPIRALLDLVEESSHQVHKTIRLLGLLSLIFSFLTGFLLVLVIIDLITGIGFFIVFFPFELLVIGFIVMFIPLVKMLRGSASFFIYYDSRHHIIDNVRFGKIPQVPQGKDPLARLISYFEHNDPVIKNAMKMDSTRFKYDVKVKTGSGDDYELDAYFEGENTLAHEPDTVGLPRGRFFVYVKVFRQPMTLSALKELRSVVEHDAASSQAFPLRIIALQQKLLDLNDDVYEYVLENPVALQNSLWHMQIASEDGEVYSFIPIVAYETEEG